MKRMSLAILLLAGALSVGGCRFVAPAAERFSADGSKTEAIIHHWGRDARQGERFIDNYLLNYDVNDPYRGDRLVGY